VNCKYIQLTPAATSVHSTLSIRLTNFILVWFYCNDHVCWPDEGISSPYGPRTLIADPQTLDPVQNHLNAVHFITPSISTVYLNVILPSMSGIHKLSLHLRFFKFKIYIECTSSSYMLHNLIHQSPCGHNLTEGKISVQCGLLYGDSDCHHAGNVIQ
jgi:hypothetical protein